MSRRSASRFRTANLRLATGLLTLVCACGGGGGSAPARPPDPPVTSATIRYLRVDPAYDGWGLHLWGNALAPGVATQWTAPRLPDRIENGAAVFEISLANAAGELNFVAHNGDLKSPTSDLGIVPQSFGIAAWIVQDTATVFASEAAAIVARDGLGNASSGLDLSGVVANDVDSGLASDWADSASFLEIYVRGYQDSDGDGIGDIQGLVSRLDYLQSLGITAIWLMPVSESADNDHGYAVQDYRAIESDYGSMSDFETLLSEAHARGIAVIIDYVMNHAASTNPLFLDATTTAGNDKRDWFIWEDSHPQGWNTFGGDPWHNNGNGWYYGIFSPLMPDFNLRNPEVVAYHKDNLRFWLNKGVDGFRLDAVSVLFENGANAWEDAPENHLLLGEIQTLLSTYNKRYMVCEAPASPSDYAAVSSCGRAFAFQVPGAILNSARGNSADANFVNHLLLAQADRMPLFLSNHDSFAGARVWNQLNGNQEYYKLAAASYLLAARTPFSYYGEEVGMANGAGLAGDQALRTPMSWNSDPNNAGFSAVTPFRALSANSTTQNVALESSDGTSLLNYYAALMTLRSDYPAIGAGTLDVQSVGGDPVLLMARTTAGACAVIVINYSSQDQPVLAMTQCPNATFTRVFGGSDMAVAAGSGRIVATIPARSAVVYIATRT